MKSARALTILATLIGIVAACTVTTDNKETPVTSTSGPSGQPEFSLLTDSGVEQIKDSRRARFDFRDLTLTNAEVGLPSDHTQDVIIGGAGEPDVELTLVGPDAEETVRTQTIWVANSRDGQFNYITFWRSFSSPEDAQQELAEISARWGILPANVDSWTEIAANARKDKKEKQNLGSGIGPTGLIIDLNASIKNGVQVFQYFVLLNARNYTPENIENIRTTGIGKIVAN